jgi:SAM-dependent methyltransferase
VTASSDATVAAAERQRIRTEYQRRAREVDPERYTPWQPGQMFMLAGMRRQAAAMLHEAGAFPKSGDKCLEVGFGSQGWLGVLISWGVREQDLSGIELDAARARLAQEVLPVANLRVGDATELPWPDGTFTLVVASTVFTSILDNTIRHWVAQEITRVLAPGGALLWYDFAVNNPANSNVRGVKRKELRALFPNLRGRTRWTTLAPPLARRVAPVSWTLATVLEAVPMLRTHLMAVLRKPAVMT